MPLLWRLETELKRYDLINGGMRGEIYTNHTETGQGVYGRYYWGDILDVLKLLVPKYAGKVQLIYMDPPFFTGQTFKYQQRIGSKGWKGDRNYIVSHIAYVDRYDREVFLKMMKEIFLYAHRLLSHEGCIYVHIDYRTSAYMKVMLDDIFGEENFLNEIIWHYRSGGRAKRHFSRKHDNILFYRKSEQYYFDIDAVGKPRGTDKKNNMKKNIDEDGRVYWSIRSAGKEYRYYADDKIYPSDVWDDIPHLHQRNPERTGYDTQKPEALLERIVLASSRPDDLVIDFFAGSGTTLAVAQKHGRNWLGIDSSIFSLHTCRKRLLDSDNINNVKFLYIIEDENMEIVETPFKSKLGAGSKVIFVSEFVEDVDNIDHWGVGYIADGMYNGIKYSTRSAESPNLDAFLALEEIVDSETANVDICVHTVDIQGEQKFYINQKEE